MLFCCYFNCCSPNDVQHILNFLQGIERIYDVMPDIVIDVPAAYNILERFVLRCKMAGLLTDELVRKMPSRGRKRFVSEGDGGLIKEGLW